MLCQVPGRWQFGAVVRCHPARHTSFLAVRVGCLPKSTKKELAGKAGKERVADGMCHSFMTNSWPEYDSEK